MSDADSILVATKFVEENVHVLCRHVYRLQEGTFNYCQEFEDLCNILYFAKPRQRELAEHLIASAAIKECADEW